MTAPEPECRHGMVPAFCADCTGRTGTPDLLPALSPPFHATYAGECAHCGDHFPADAFIVRTADGWAIAEHTWTAQR